MTGKKREHLEAGSPVENNYFVIISFFGAISNPDRNANYSPRSIPGKLKDHNVSAQAGLPGIHLSKHIRALFLFV